jgi:hypothetical protein
MRAHPRTAAIPVLLFLLLVSGSAWVQPAETPASEPERVEVRWDVEAPWLGISWHGSLAMTRTQAEPSTTPPARSRVETHGSLAKAARTAVQLVHALLQFPAGLMAQASAHLFG